MSNRQIIFTYRESNNMLNSKEIKRIAETIIASKAIPEYLTCSVSVRTSNDFYAGKCAHVKIKMGNVSPEELKSSGLLKKPSQSHHLACVKYLGCDRQVITSIIMDFCISVSAINSLAQRIEEDIDALLTRHRYAIHLMDQMNDHVRKSEYTNMVSRGQYVYGSDLPDGDYHIALLMGKERFSTLKTAVYDDTPDTSHIFRTISFAMGDCAKRVLMSYAPVIPEQLMSRFRDQVLSELSKCELSKNSSAKRYFFNGGWVGSIPDVGVTQSNSLISNMGSSLRHAHEYVRRVVRANELSDYFIVGVDSYGMSLRGINAIEIMVYSQNTGFSCGRIKYHFDNMGRPILGDVEYGFFQGCSFNYLP